jgi:hypothetical protein
MQIGTKEQIEVQERAVCVLEHALMKAKMRLRALKGEALMQPGDSYPVMLAMEEMQNLMNEFGARNLQAA